jgi:hypothetical protein
MRTESWVAGALVLSGAVFYAACAEPPKTCVEYANCELADDAGTGGSDGGGGTSGAGGTGGTGGTSSDGGDCDTSKSPGEEACLVEDEHAVFVSPSGSDTGAGTKSDPVASIGKGIEIAQAAGKLVIACSATYDERVSITAGTKLFGGFDCSSWVHDSSNPTKVEPSARGYALEVNGVSSAVVIEDVSFKAQPGSDPGESSIGAFVNASTDVTFARVTIAAGAGKAGADSVMQPFVFPTQTELSGNNGTASAGGNEKSCSCPGGAVTVGGIGGNPATTGQGGGMGLPNNGAGEGGQAGKECNAGGAGGKGAPGKTVTDGQGAMTPGSASSSGWQPSSGSNGQPGGPGQGGGGGASVATGGGGGGGCGGCGGAAGSAGGSGGASIALLSVDSTIAMSGGALTSADGGAGAKGVAGQGGQQEFGFAGSGVVGGCQGGNGGAGAPGSSGGGGAGGPSAGVVHKGAAPTLEGTTISTGNGGAKGLGGTPGSNDGAVGAKEDVLPSP